MRRGRGAEPSADSANEGDVGFKMRPGARRLAADRGVPLLPGVATPTEVQLALAHGVSWLKAFPARWLGCEWFSLIRGPFPQVRFVATGGPGRP